MSVLDVPPPAFMLEPEIQMFADSAHRFFERAAPADRIGGWRAAGQVEREVWRGRRAPAARVGGWRAAGGVGGEFWGEPGAAGFLGVTVPEAYGGPGADFRH